MDVSNLKLDLYDIFGLITPGVLVICEIWIAVCGWARFIAGVSTFSATGLTLLVFASFAVGPLVQEIAHAVIKLATRNKRFSESRRDEIWKSEVGAQVREKLQRETGVVPANVDVGFDMCMALSPDHAARHDLFLAQSAMARSLLFVSFLSALPVGISIAQSSAGRAVKITEGALVVLAIAFVMRVCWNRMRRFRALSAEAVFHTYLASKPREVAATA